MMKTMTLSLFFCCFFAGIISAQYPSKKEDAEIKNLKRQLYQQKTDSVKARIAMQLSTSYRNILEKDSCQKYASIALDITNKNPNITLKYKRIQAKVFENLGSTLSFDDSKKATKTLQIALKLWKEIGDKNGIARVYFSLGETNSFKRNSLVSIDYFNKALVLFKETKDQTSVGNTLLKISLEKRYLGRYGDALEYSIKALKVGEMIKDSVLITNCLLANGFNYMLASNFQEALQEQKKALKIFQLTKNQNGIATTYNDMGTTELQANNLDGALKYNKIALEIRKKIGNPNEISISYNYISWIYRRQGKYKEALAISKLGLPYALKFGDSRFIMDAYLELGDNYTNLKDYKNAIINYNLANEVAEKNNSKSYQAIALMQIGRSYLKAGNTKEALLYLKNADKIVQPNDFKTRKAIYETLIKIYVNENDYKNGFENQVKYQQTNDSMNAIEKAEKITSLTQKLIYENKHALQKASQDKEIAIQQSQISEQKLIRNLSIAGLVIGAILSIVFFVRLKEKRRLNINLEKTLVNLKTTQKQLVQSEKMASLGELTAGIAHEIQNPLNFVNNFSEVSSELLVEMKTELERGNTDDAKELANDVIQNLKKINVHGKRADAIVKGMLQHSRSSTGVKEPTDLNALCDEYLRLSYHGLRAKDKSFNATIHSDFDESIGKINLIPQDFGRVILNLLTNAFYVVDEKNKLGIEGYEPTVSIATIKENDKIFITVSDNGNGIPKEVKAKIFQPFFTTKPTGKGTGLGLSMSYDIITKGHNGELKVKSKENEGTTFSIILKT